MTNMTLDTARAFFVSLTTKNNSMEDLEAVMGKSLRHLPTFCADVVIAYNLLAESDVDDVELAEEVRGELKAAFNYDEKGNYIGDVPNENGWTA